MRRRILPRMSRLWGARPKRFLQQLRRLGVLLSAFSIRSSIVHLLTFALVLVTLSLLFSFVNQVVQSARLEQQRSVLEAEVATLEEENRQTQGAVDYAESDVHVEQVARGQLGYAREDEIVVLPQVALATPTAVALSPEALPMPTPAPNWQGWWQALFPSAARQ